MAKTPPDKEVPLYTDKDEDRLYKPAKKFGAEIPYRTQYRKDYGRLIHSASFRRLQGKTQLFPSNESDFSRNRLTHSLEVAQIAKSIAQKINYEMRAANFKLDLDVVEVAGLAHDLGHPPFGHNGEEALDECMRNFGGFEGNAQTLRILTKLEKKIALSDGDTGRKLTLVQKKKDARYGLNLTARTLGAVLKYDYKIPIKGSKRIKKYKTRAPKGFYSSESEVVDFVKKAVLGKTKLKKGTDFKTIECQIMDLADDIAYSTYDIEDAFKAKFLHPLKLISLGSKFYAEIAEEVEGKIVQVPEYQTKGRKPFTQKDVILIIVRMFENILLVDTGSSPLFEAAGKLHRASEAAAAIGYERTAFTSKLVNDHVANIKFEHNDQIPALSKAYFDIETFKIVETMKMLAFKALIDSPMLKLAEYRGKDIVKKIFETIAGNEKTPKRKQKGKKKVEKHKGYQLLPSDFKDLYVMFEGNEAEQKRVVCDYIAGMTDKYALDFYNRIFGTTPESIHKPL